MFSPLTSVMNVKHLMSYTGSNCIRHDVIDISKLDAMAHSM